MIRLTTNFSKLLSASKILSDSGDSLGAKTLIDAAAALVPASETGLCGKCLRRRQSAVEALAQAEAQLRDGSSNRKNEPVAAAR